MPQKNGQIIGLPSDPLMSAMLSRYRWDTSSGDAINWAISNGFSGEYWTNSSKVIETVSSALFAVSYYSNLSFNFVGYFDNPDSSLSAGADINVSLSQGAPFNSDLVWAIGYPPSPLSIHRGDIYLNIQSEANALSYELGSAGFFLLLHELGHALGLKHPHDGGGTSSPTFAKQGIGILDNDYFTVMSYNDDHNWNRISWDPSTFMPLDVLALQYLYGVNEKTNATDTNYRLLNDGLYLTLWDAGGSDTVYAPDTEAWNIELPFALLTSYASPLVGVAHTVENSQTSIKWLMGDIENAVGGPYSDRIYGNKLGNILWGGAGDDVIDGKSGDDIIEGGSGNDVVFGGDGWDVVNYRLKSDSARLAWQNNTWLVSAKDQGSDLIYDIELLMFSDKLVRVMTKNHAEYSAVSDDLWFFFLIAFNGAPGVTYMDWMLDRTGNGKSIKSFVDVFVTAPQFKEVYPDSITNEAFAKKLAANTLKGTAAPIYEQAVVDKLMGLMDSGSTRSDVIFNAIGDMKWVSTNSLIWGKTAQLFEKQKQVAKFYTDVMSQSTTDAATLRSVVANVKYDTDLSSPEKIVELIGLSLLGNFDLLS